MNTKLYVLLAAAVLSLSACKNETATAQGEAAEAAAATEAAGDAAAEAAAAAGTAAAEGVDAAAAATGEAAAEVAANVDQAADAAAVPPTRPPPTPPRRPPTLRRTLPTRPTPMLKKSRSNLLASSISRARASGPFFFGVAGDRPPRATLSRPSTHAVGRPHPFVV